MDLKQVQNNDTTAAESNDTAASKSEQEGGHFSMQGL